MSVPHHAMSLLESVVTSLTYRSNARHLFLVGREKQHWLLYVALAASIILGRHYVFQCECHHYDQLSFCRYP